MTFKKKKRIVQHQYTIIELLVVLVIAGLLTGISIGGIRGALARQGAAGGVRTLSAKISLAQSFAVSRNRYVALLMPDYDKVDVGSNKDVYTISNNTNTSSWDDNYAYCFTKNRLCYVTKGLDGSGNTEYTFDRWVKGYEWKALPSKTVAFITEQTNVDDSTPAKVIGIQDPTTTTTSLIECTALIFKPSGALINANQVVIRVFRAAYLPNQGTGSEKVFYWQGKEDKNKGWKIVINGFTGRTKFCLGGEKIDN